VHHKKREAIATVHHASELADQAIVSANNRKAAAERARRNDIGDSAAAVQQSAANANMRADSDDAAHLFRSDRAHHSELMPPGR